MGEQGKVIDEKGGIAIISFNRTEACAKCKACMAGFMESQMILEANNSIGAKLGDIVVIELKGQAFITASAIMYAVPLAMMLTGFFGGQAIAAELSLNTDIFSFFLGIGLLALSYITIRLSEKKIKTLPMFLPYVSQIVTEAVHID